MKATSAFADDDWEDIQGSIPHLMDFCDKQPPTKVSLITITLIPIIFKT
jgi:hypothetical protein